MPQDRGKSEAVLGTLTILSNWMGKSLVCESRSVVAPSSSKSVGCECAPAELSETSAVLYTANAQVDDLRPYTNNDLSHLMQDIGGAHRKGD